MKTRGAALLIVLGVLGLLGVGALALKPKIFHGASKRAQASVEASKAVEVASQNLIDTTKKQSAEAAASVQKIGEANSIAPDSPSKDFIAQEVPVALSKLEKPDVEALLVAERRRAAVMEGRAKEAEKLYSEAMQRSDALQKERNSALEEKTKADAARALADQNLLIAAESERVSEAQRNRFIIIAVVCVGLYLYTKFTHIGPGALAEVARDLRDKVHADPIHALDGATTRLQQGIVRFINKLKA